MAKMRKKATKKATAKAQQKTNKPATKAAKPDAAKAKPETNPKGSISATIYETIEKLVAQGGLSRAAAFRQLSKQTGRKEGTVAVNYYYAAKKRGAKLRTRRRAAGKASARSRTGGLSTRLQSLLGTLEELIRKQQAELDVLRRDNGRFVEIRKLIARA